MTDAPAKIETNHKPLTGLRVLVTRPLKQAESLIAKLQLQGALVSHQPAILIDAVLSADQTPIIDSINQYDRIIFISKNAVEYGLTLIAKTRMLSNSFPLAAIGKVTRDTLIDDGFTNVYCPDEGFDSEALLASSEFSAANIQNKKILIVRGGAGREHLKEHLQARQANVTYLDVYQRQPAELVLSAADFSTLDVITISSQQGLENLVAMLDAGTLALLQTKRLISPSQRCSDRASQLGFKQIETAANATDDAMLNCIVDIISNAAMKLGRCKTGHNND